ncbi:hypothetical protein [Streptomyces sp. NBC_01618]|uniref:hypothetical protein n=1 Tax=Streptomyces sp. NBC_01618 TaxID=2975900 RepID=UPI00386E30CD
MKQGEPAPHNRPGRDGVEPNAGVAALPAWTVTHLHGAQTGAGTTAGRTTRLEHEDMGMMRPFVVMPPQAMKFDHGAGHGGHHGHSG